MKAPGNKRLLCADYFPLPDVMPGDHGQVFPPSRMHGRKEPRTRLVGAPVQAQAELKPIKQQRDPASPPAIDAPTERPPKQTRQQSPAANPGLDGKRLCGCGALLPKRKRCCEACRRERRGQTRQRSRKSSPMTFDAAHRRARKAQERTPGSPGAARTVIAGNDTPRAFSEAFMPGNVHQGAIQP